MRFKGKKSRNLLLVMSYCNFVTSPCGTLGQVWYLIVLIPDLCRLSVFETIQHYFSFREKDMPHNGHRFLFGFHLTNLFAFL